MKKSKKMLKFIKKLIKNHMIGSSEYQIKSDTLKTFIYVCVISSRHLMEKSLEAFDGDFDALYNLYITLLATDAYTVVR